LFLSLPSLSYEKEYKKERKNKNNTHNKKARRAIACKATGGERSDSALYNHITNE
jgi:hypothetical protein